MAVNDGADVQGFQYPSLDTLSAETRHDELLRQARAHLGADNQPGFWRALLAAVSGRARNER